MKILFGFLLSAGVLMAQIPPGGGRPVQVSVDGTNFAASPKIVFAPGPNIALASSTGNGTTTVTINGTVAAATASWSGVIDFGSIADGACLQQTVVATGAAVGTPLSVSSTTAFADNLVATAWISATDTVKVQLCNLSGGAIDPASNTYKVTTAAGGDLVGPASAVDGEAMIYDGITGKLAKRFAGSGIGIFTSGVLSTSSSLQWNATTGVGLIKPLTLGQVSTEVGTLHMWGTSNKFSMAPAAATAEWTLTLPANDGDANQVLQTNGSGVTSWATAADANQAANTVKAGPTSGADAAPAYRALVAADMPSGASVPTSTTQTINPLALYPTIAVGAPSANALAATNTLYVIPFFLPFNKSVTKIHWRLGTNDSGDTGCIGIYNSSKALIASTGTLDLGVTGSTYYATDIAEGTISLTAGFYWLGSTATSTAATFGSLTTVPTAATYQNTLAPAAVAGTAGATTGGACPASFTTITGAAATHPWVSIY
jgi:hypothetical protein